MALFLPGPAALPIAHISCTRIATDSGSDAGSSSGHPPARQRRLPAAAGGGLQVRSRGNAHCRVFRSRPPAAHHQGSASLQHRSPRPPAGPRPRPGAAAGSRPSSRRRCARAQWWRKAQRRTLRWAGALVRAASCSALRQPLGLPALKQPHHWPSTLLGYDAGGAARGQPLGGARERAGAGGTGSSEGGVL